MKITIAEDVGSEWTFFELHAQSYGLQPDPMHCFQCGEPFAEGDRLVFAVADRDASKLAEGVRRMAMQLAHQDCDHKGSKP